MPPADPTTLPSSRVLVTGASGFLGKAIVLKLLEQGRQVRGLCRRPQPDLEARGVEMVYADLADAPAARAACQDCHTVFHVASKVGVWGTYREFHDTNVLGTQAIVNGCRDFLVQKLIYTSTPSVVFNDRDLAGADESLPYGEDIPSPYPATKAIAEKAVLAAHDLPPGHLQTIALRPHLIWGPGDPNLVPRVLQRARQGRLRIVGHGRNRVDLTYIDNVVDAHLDAERALGQPNSRAGGNAYFISNGEPVELWPWINSLLQCLGIQKVERSISLKTARRLGGALEAAWALLPLRGEPPMTRFVAAELAKDHWFDISAAKRDLGYRPGVNMEEGMRRLLPSLKDPSRQ